jgi:hypothetical protein
MKGRMNIYRFVPYLSLSIASIILIIITNFIKDQNIKNILINVFSNAMFFFVVYIFYDLIKILITKKEKKYLNEYIKNIISNDIFVALYYLKKIIYGYNLETNTLNNIIEIANYSKNELHNTIKNQNYLGFQIFKNTDEIRSLFRDIINDNLFLKHYSHIDTINILKISHNLKKLEFIFKNITNFNICAESGIEYTIANGKQLNPENDDKLLLLKKTNSADRFVVYDSGYFENEFNEKLLNRYILKMECASDVSKILNETFSLMKYWLSNIIQISKKDNRFRIIKDYFNPFTNTKTKKSKIYVADIVDIK